MEASETVPLSIVPILQIVNKKTISHFRGKTEISATLLKKLKDAGILVSITPLFNSPVCSNRGVLDSDCRLLSAQ